MKYYLLLLIVCLSNFSFAEERPVPEMYKLIAGEEKVPYKLFYALILNESRSVVNDSGSSKILPWPWTVNYKGNPYYFQSKREAVIFTEELINSGIENFDVGLGQINWKWHKSRFTSIDRAFDPYINLKASAKHLREQFDRQECNSWILAVGCYHRPARGEKDKLIAMRYTNKVLKIWERI